MSNELKQVAQGCHTRVMSYKAYDVSGYRFRTATHERERPNATTINSGVLTIGLDGTNTSVEYYGIIEIIITDEDNETNDIQVDAEEVMDEADLELLNGLHVDRDGVDSTTSDSDDEFHIGPLQGDATVDEYF